MNSKLLRASLISLTILVLVSSCKDDPEEPKPEPKLLEITSISPTSGVEGETLKLNIANFSKNRIVDNVTIGDTWAVIKEQTDNYITVSVPYFKEGGKKTVTLNLEQESGKVYEPGFEFLAMSLEPLPTTTKLRDRGTDTLVVSLKNMPKGAKAENFTFVGTLPNGEKDLASPLESVAIEGSNLIIESKKHFSVDWDMKTYLLYMNSEFEMTGLEWVDMVRPYQTSGTFTPDQQLKLFTTKGPGSLKAYIDGEELPYLSTYPLGDAIDDYFYIVTFSTPHKPAGEYELELRLSSNGEVLPFERNYSNHVVIEDMFHCAESATYSPGDSLKIFLQGGQSIKPTDCYECPTKVSLWDAARQTEFVAPIGKTHYNEFKAPGSSYVVVKLPDAIVPDLYSIEVQTPFGYVYKLKDGCENEMVKVE